MDFKWAIEQMKKGLKVRTLSMSPVVYLVEEDGYPRWKGIMDDAGTREVCFELIESLDWEIVDDKKSLYDKELSYCHECRRNAIETKDVREFIKELVDWYNEQNPIVTNTQFSNKIKELVGD